MKTRYSTYLAALCALLAIGSGCALRGGQKQLVPEAPPVIYPTIAHVDRTTEGSLWSGDDSWTLFSDDKANQAGDLVMVRIIEDSKAEKKTQTEVARDADLTAGISNFFGQEARFGTGRLVEGNSQDIDIQNLITASSKAGFKSGASVMQSGKVLANVMAQVTERTPEGNLRIFGSQVIAIDKEDQVVTVSGLVRPSDVLVDNSISSALIADARISYSGRGPASTSSRPGWMFQIFYAVWPF